MSQPNILIISDDAEFSRMVVNRWQTERVVPAFTVVSSVVSSGVVSSAFDIAIVGGLPGDVLNRVLTTIEPLGRPVIAVVQDAAAAKRVREKHPRTVLLREALGWVDMVLVVAQEGVKRNDAMERARKAEEKAETAQRDAVLGRYMLEMRHNLNNALTSVLGNAELLLLEPAALSPEMHEQVETIHTMSLRINEIVQRFSSLETEMSFVDRQSHGETSIKVSVP